MGSPATRDEPVPPDPAWPRYSRIVLPPYRYVPGRSPHPRRDPGGHAYGRPELGAVTIDPAAWATSALYLGAVDLYNFAYWWEAHEALEALWLGADREGPVAQLAQGVIQIAASNLKRFMGAERAARSLAERGLARLRTVPSPWIGMDVRRFERDATEYLAGARGSPALIAILFPHAEKP